MRGGTSRSNIWRGFGLLISGVDCWIQRVVEVHGVLFLGCGVLFFVFGMWCTVFGMWCAVFEVGFGFVLMFRGADIEDFY